MNEKTIEAFNEIGDILNANENWVIVRDNFENRIDEWDKGNPLWITGASGDGKSTLARKLSKENNAEIITSDTLLFRMACKNEEEVEEALNNDIANAYNVNAVKNSPALEYIRTHDLPYDIKKGKKQITVKDVQPYCNDFYMWLMDELANNPKYNDKLYIIEGSNICGLDPEIMAQKPVIVVDGSILRSLLRRSKRDAAEKERPLILSIWKYLRKYNSHNK